MSKLIIEICNRLTENETFSMAAALIYILRHTRISYSVFGACATLFYTRQMTEMQISGVTTRDMMHNTQL